MLLGDCTSETKSRQRFMQSGDSNDENAKSLQAHLSLTNGRKMSFSTTGSLDGTATETDIESINTDFDSREASPSRPSQLSPRRVCWPDHLGQDLVTIHALEEAEQVSVRVIVLLLQQRTKQFEFVHCEFSTLHQLLVSDVLDQLPRMAMWPFFQQTRFVALVREAPAHEELVPTLNLATYGLRDGEIIIAAATPGISGISSKSSVSCRACLKQSKRILKAHDKLLRKAARKARIQGRALQTLLSTDAWRAKLAADVPRERGRRRDSPRKYESYDIDTDDDEANSDIIKAGFLPRKILREYRRLTDACTKETSDSDDSHDDLPIERPVQRIKRRRRRRNTLPYIEVITWIRTSELPAKDGGGSSRQLLPESEDLDTFSPIPFETAILTGILG